MKFSVENLYNDQGVLNFEFIDDPDEDDDLVLYQYAKELRKTKFKEVIIPFKFRDYYDPDDNFSYSKEYDYETQTNIIPHKKHNIYLTNLEKDYALMILKLTRGKFSDTDDYKQAENSEKYYLMVDTMKLKKDNDPFTHRHVGLVRLGYDGMSVIIGCIRGYTCQTMWKHFDKFLLNESKLDDDLSIAYDKDLKHLDYEIEELNRHDCVFPF